MKLLLFVFFALTLSGCATMLKSMGDSMVEASHEPLPEQTHCESDMLGGMNCGSIGGPQQHCVSDMLGGFNCN